MSKDVEPIGEPIQFHAGANVYCKYCNTWGTIDLNENFYTQNFCGNCGKVGFLILNPFPDNLVPYYVMPKKTDSNILEQSNDK